MEVRLKVNFSQVQVGSNITQNHSPTGSRHESYMVIICPQEKSTKMKLGKNGFGLNVAELSLLVSGKLYLVIISPINKIIGQSVIRL